MIELPELIQQIIVSIVTIALMGLLLIEKIKPAYIFFGAVLIFLLTGTISTDDFLKALSNESILSIFLLIFITYGVRTNFNILSWMDKLFGSAKTGRGFVFRMTSVVSLSSSFLNNTPIVALFLPYVYQWSRKRDISPSKLLIPLSFAAMAGGMITVIGTSTNLILKGLVEAEGETPPGALDYLIPGLLVTAGTVLYLATIGYSILPSREELLKKVLKKQREYKIEVKLAEESELIGKTVAEAELYDLDEIHLFEIIRYGMRISPVYPYEKIQEHDHLVFVGNSDKIIELLERGDEFAIPYLDDEADKIDKIKKIHASLAENVERDKNGEEEKEESERNIVETVIPANSTLIGRTLKGYRFNERYDAAVIGIHRNGEELDKQIDRVPLKAGDLLLLVTGKEFRKTAQEDDLYVVSIIKNIQGVSGKFKNGFFGVILAVIAALAFGKISLFFGLILISSYMVASRMVSINELKEQFSVNLFIVLVASLAFSTALINSGVAEMVAEGFMKVFESMGNYGIVVGIYLVTLIVASFVTHAAAVAIVFPIVFSIGSQLPDMDMTAIFIAIAFAASASFHTPFSYQTNMMVYGPGGYKFSDFLKSGIPLTVLYSVLVLGFILFYYQFG